MVQVPGDNKGIRLHRGNRSEGRCGVSKYNSKKTVVNGQTFDSRKEAKHYQELLLLERAGKIHDLRTQVKFVLIPSSGAKIRGR